MKGDPPKSNLMRGMSSKRRWAAVAVIAYASHPLHAGAKGDELAQGFLNPPPAAEPRVWWHWMNGNITEEGIRLDLQWMHQSGIGGAQIFEGDLGTPQVVPQPLPYMSAGWRQAFKTAVDTAKSLDVDLTIASSPGWSSAGGPWVAPPDAMKKLVWSETLIPGGTHFRANLPAPPAISGPFQQIPKSAVQAGAPSNLPQFYRDIRVIAFRDTTGPLSKPESARTSIGTVDAAVLTDQDFQSGVSLPPDEQWVEYRYGSAQHISAVVLGIPTPPGIWLHTGASRDTPGQR